MADDASRTGATYLTSEILSYVAGLHAPHDPALQAAFDAPGRHAMPAVQVGPSEGKLLGVLLRLVGARSVVEIGTLAGYSALHLARAVGPDGKVFCLESNEAHARVARENLAAAGLAGVAEVLVGPALETLPSIAAHGPFDAVFIDADKANYDAYGRWAAANVRPGGLLLGDNAFFFGNLLDPADPAAAAMRRFHEEAPAHFDSVCIATPDGLLLGVRRPS